MNSFFQTIPGKIIGVIAGGGISAINIFEIVQPIIGIIAGLFTIVGSIVLIRVNLQRRKNLIIENQRLRKELEKCDN